MEESKNDYNKSNKLIDSRDFFFNYRNDENFNKINILETKPINNYDNYFTFNPSLNNTRRLIKNEYSYKSNLTKKYNNKNREIKFTDLKNSVSSIDSMKIREISEEENEIQKQIKYEERLLQNLKEEKNKLIEEEKKRREIILYEINNNKNKIKEKKEEIKEILFECQKEKKELKIKKEKEYDIQNDNNYYKEYLEKIRKRNELINQNSNKIINQKINKENKLYNNTAYNSYNKYRKIKIDNNGYNNKYQVKTNTNNIRKRKKEKNETVINLNSYFQLSEKEKEKNFNYTSSDNIINNTVFNSKKNNIHLTPNGLYRSNNTDDSKNNTNKIYKVLSPDNNNNFMTQTRFYRSRSRINTDELISHYAKEKVMKNNSSRNKSYYRNRNILINPEIFNSSKECYKKPYEEIYFNYSNNLFKNQRFNTYKSNCFLEKRKTDYNLQELKENKSNKSLKIDFNDKNNNNLCNDCLRKKILFI